jgi:iron(III) transport system permease protein
MAPSKAAIDSMTFDNYRNLWNLPIVHRALWNSFVLGISSSTITMLLTAIIAWIIVRSKWRGKGALDFLAFSPIAMPGLVLGIAILWLYLVLPVPVYGTLWILLIAYVTKYLPYGMRACSSSMLQIKKELEEASEASGAPAAQQSYPSQNPKAPGDKYAGVRGSLKAPLASSPCRGN